MSEEVLAKGVERVVWVSIGVGIVVIVVVVVPLLGVVVVREFDSRSTETIATVR